MNHFIAIAILFFSATSNGQEKRNFNKQLYLNGAGQIKLIYIFTGEPISRPRSLRIYIKCDKNQSWDPVGEFQMCELKNYQLDVKQKKLALTYIDGRVNPLTGESVCDQNETGEVDLSTICKP